MNVATFRLMKNHEVRNAGQFLCNFLLGIILENCNSARLSTQTTEFSVFLKILTLVKHLTKLKPPLGADVSIKIILSKNGTVRKKCVFKSFFL